MLDGYRKRFNTEDPGLRRRSYGTLTFKKIKVAFLASDLFALICASYTDMLF